MPSAKEVAVVDVPQMNFLMIDGRGDPNKAQEYREAVEALYAVSYTLKFLIKKEKGVDYAVMPLEGLWWADDMAKFSVERKDEWKWISMIMQPEYVTMDFVNSAIEQVRRKKNPPALAKTRFKNFEEGLSAQIMHIGPFSAEGPTIKRLHDFIKGKGYALRGKHHEVYLSDPRKVAPEKMRTVIRQPVSKS